MKFFDKFLFFGDRKVMDYLKIQVKFWDNSEPRPRPVRATPRTVTEIANGTQLSKTRVRECLQRLARKSLVEREMPNRWRVVLSGSKSAIRVLPFPLKRLSPTHKEPFNTFASHVLAFLQGQHEDCGAKPGTNSMCDQCRAVEELDQVPLP